MRREVLAFGFLLGFVAPSHAQWVVHDAAVTARNSVTAALKEQLLAVQRQQHSELRRMAQRLSLFTNLAKYRLIDVPRWRIHDFEGATFLFANDYHAALNYGDASGRGLVSVSHPRLDATIALERLAPPAGRALLSQLATLDATDAAVMAATHDSGRLRFNGRRELAAIEDLQHDVTNGSLEQSMTAVLDKISGAGLIGARQRQARIQLLGAIVEQLLVEGKRSRDAEAVAMNMQLIAWRDRAAANHALVAGSGDALRTWRQP